MAAYLQNRQRNSFFMVLVIKAFMEELKRVIPPDVACSGMESQHCPN